MVIYFFTPSVHLRCTCAVGSPVHYLSFFLFYVLNFCLFQHFSNPFSIPSQLHSIYYWCIELLPYDHCLFLLWLLLLSFSVSYIPFLSDCSCVFSFLWLAQTKYYLSLFLICPLYSLARPSRFPCVVNKLFYSHLLI